MNEPANRRFTNPHVDRIRELNDRLRTTLTGGTTTSTPITIPTASMTLA